MIKEFPSRNLKPPITAFRWFIEYGGRFETKWENQVSFVNPYPSITYHAGLCAPNISVPLLMLVSPDDEMPGAEAEISQLVFNLVQGPKEWVDLEGGHFGIIYFPSEEFDKASEVQVNFLENFFY